MKVKEEGHENVAIFIGDFAGNRVCGKKYQQLLHYNDEIISSLAKIIQSQSYSDKKNLNLLPTINLSWAARVTNEEVRAKIQQAIGPHEGLLTIVKNADWSDVVMSPVH